MIRLQDIQAALLPVVGWKQEYNPEHQIDPLLCQSISGLTFQGAHPLCTLANVRAIMPDDYLYQFPEWKSTQLYTPGYKVRHTGKVWKDIVASIDDEPGTQLGANYWDEYNL